jgi:malate dehydrogenase
MFKSKISVIGAGNVGATTAHLLALKELGNIILLDVVEGMPQGKALDIAESGPLEQFDAYIKGTNSYEDTKDSDIIIITAGVSRKPGMDRDDLLETNTKIVKECAKKSAEYSPDAIIIVVTNPLDAMVYVAAKASGFPKQRIVGMGGILDSTRFAAFIAKELDISVEEVNTLVLGGHGDSMVFLLNYSTANVIPIADILPKEKIDELVERTKNGGKEIVELLKTGSAYYAPASSVSLMVETILKDKKRLLPCSAFCDKEYGIGGFFIGVPIKLGKKGVEEIVELKLTDKEKEDFKNSVEHVKKLVEDTEKYL